LEGVEYTYAFYIPDIPKVLEHSHTFLALGGSDMHVQQRIEQSKRR
jgi:hypothetical protein